MNNMNQWTTPPEMILDLTKKYQAILQTEKGDIEVDLFADKVPETVNNFVFLAKEGYYNGTIFHRVIENFMAQGGDPTGTGRGGPGYQFSDEFDPDLRHNKPGVLSMANAGPNSNGSQFFITHIPTPWLDNRHSVFGQVARGMDTLLSIPPRDPSKPDYPGIKLLNVTIHESEV